VEVAYGCQHIESKLSIGGIGFTRAVCLAMAAQVDGEDFKACCNEDWGLLRPAFLGKWAAVNKQD